MKKIALSLLALTALSGASFAGGSDRSHDLRESPAYFGKYAASTARDTSVSQVNAFAQAPDVSSQTSFERMIAISAERQEGSR